jgi:hypothetical protein
MKLLFTSHNFYITTSFFTYQFALFFISLKDYQHKQISYKLSTGENLTYAFQTLFRSLQTQNVNLITINYLIKNQPIDLSFIIVDSFIRYLENKSIPNSFIFIKENKTLLIESTTFNLKIVGFDIERYSKYSKIK